MKLAMCVVILGACLLHQGSASKNKRDSEPDHSSKLDSRNKNPTHSTIPTTRRITRTTSTMLQAPTSRGTTPSPSPTPPAATHCPCVTTPEYNPICGDDKITYNNQGLLDCARRCGRAVGVLFYGRCEKVA